MKKIFPLSTSGSCCPNRHNFVPSPISNPRCGVHFTMHHRVRANRTFTFARRNGHHKMSTFIYRDHTLYAEQVSVAECVRQYGTPLYIYSQSALSNNYFAYARAQERIKVCYAVKANSNIRVLNILAGLGSGFDIVSGGELARVIRAGGNCRNVVFSGVGKSSREICAALQADILSLNVESEMELDAIADCARHTHIQAPISFRINPNIKAATHPHLSTGKESDKFGLHPEQALALYEKAAGQKELSIVGISSHIGSQIFKAAPLEQMLNELLDIVDRLKANGIALKLINVGGGLGVCYRDEQPLSIGQYISTIEKKIAGRDLTLLVEPGRSIVASAGILVTQVQYIKKSATHKFAVVDAAMNDFMRPILYNNFHKISTVQEAHPRKKLPYHIVGPICESADFFGSNYMLALASQDLLAIHDTGAYGFTMSSNYNSRPRAAEVMVHGKEHMLIRERETHDSLWHNEWAPAQ